MNKVFTLLLTILMAGCGYAPRDYLNPNSSGELVAIDIASNDSALTQALRRQFALLGIQTATDTQSDVRLNQIELQRYQLVGVLGEVRLVLSATASYNINGVWHTYPIVVSTSYQHNKADPNVDDPEGHQTTKWLHQALASRVAEQYYALRR